MMIGLKALLAELLSCRVAGCSDLAEAAALADEGEVVGALLDVCVGQAHPFSLADRLAGRGVPFAFMTGQVRPAIPDRFADHPLLVKPFPADDLARIVLGFLPAGGALPPAAAPRLRAARGPRGEG